MQQDPHEKSNHDEDIDEDIEEKKGGRPVDRDRDSGMSIREIAPDVIQPTEEPPD